MQDATGAYLNRLGRTALLTPQEERDLSREIHLGFEASERISEGENSEELREAVRTGEAARDRFIRANLRLVVSIARRYPLPDSMDLLDLVQEGSLGLDQAVEKFDWRKGFRFSTYASFWIRQSIGRLLDSRGSLIHIPADRYARMRAAARHSGHRPIDSENAKLLILTRPVSLHAPRGEEGNLVLGDTIADPSQGPEEDAVDNDTIDLLTGVLAQLSPRERFVLEQRYGIGGIPPSSWRQIGLEIGLTGEGARRLATKALTKARRIVANGSGRADRDTAVHAAASNGHNPSVQRHQIRVPAA